MIDLNAIATLLFNRLALDAAGSAVRAQLGAGANGLIHAQDLAGYSADRPLPARTLLALRRGRVPTSEHIIRLPSWTWWIYDDPGQGYYRINQLIPLLEQAYTAAPVQLASGNVLGALQFDIGDETSDPALGLLCCTFKIVVEAV